MSETENVQVTPAEEMNASEPKKGRAGKEKPKKSLKREILEWVLTIVSALLIALVLRTFVFELVTVDGSSMYPTLHNGEIMFVSKTSYGTANLFGSHAIGGNPERFDVVICRYPNRGNTNFVKRVVGIPGDTVQVKNGYLIVNGIIYPEKYLSERTLGDYGPVTVPEGKYLVFGDNRNNSNDSRNSAVGMLDRTMILGRVESVLWHQIPHTLEDYNR